MPECPKCGGVLFPLKVVQCGKCTRVYYMNLIDLDIENDTKAQAEKIYSELMTKKLLRWSPISEEFNKRRREVIAIIERLIGGK